MSVGQREHHLKTDGALTVSGDANHELEFTTHTGHSYLSWPELWEEPPGFVELNQPSTSEPQCDQHDDGPPF